MRNLFLFTLFFCHGLTYQLREPLANTKNGQIRGANKLSRNRREYHSFTGIPYAKPPVGSLRFVEPQEPDSWVGTLDARKEPPVCIQRNYLFSNSPRIEGQEDCLYLNVYVPRVETFPDAKTNLLPVMVFIHWGAFIAGRSSTGYLGPQYFMDRDVILVTFNYRLGPFGFLSTGDDEAPGNYGLKDQVAVLKWVQENIGNFGGNKSKVTIFGQSAGAGSVHYHLLSPASKGLFHRAISQSGTALAAWSLPLTGLQKNITKIQSQFVGCRNTSQSKEIINCLRNISASEILQTQDYFRPFYGNPLITYTSVLEKKTEKNKNPFLTKTPLEYILKGEFQNVPWMTGVVKDEGILRAGSLLRPKKIRQDLNENFEKILSDLLMGLSLSTPHPQRLYRNLTKQYLGGRDFVDITDSGSIQGFVDLYSDRAFDYPLYQSALLQATRGHKDIYLYSFEYDGAYTYGDYFAGTNENINFKWGTCHCDDLLYLFSSPELFPKLRKWADIILSNKLVSFWTNFATYGKPNPPEDLSHPNLHWHPLKVDDSGDVKNCDINFLNITGNSETGANFDVNVGFYKDRMTFWTDSDIFENVDRLK